ncbi:YafY family transcriptional regulator [Bacillus sp. Bva_UNVM-123]|uniref:helix-turn-helix transcriptional regulator n=1 Tax=Bacillus sp. Bva_UNVM-123 TaxID=2829798 RepID=UPI00391F9753
MKLDRLLTMTMTLINRKKVTAQELAELFDVSVRTIYRDIETLSRAGIPVISYQGANGGIALMEGYRVDKHVLTKEELLAISQALKSVLTSYDDPHAESLLEKIIGIAEEETKRSFDQIFVDYSPWGKNPLLKEKITLFKQAIKTTTCVEFSYSNGEGQITNRKIEPHTLVDKGRSWYVYGYCYSRQAFRLFKLVRMKDVKLCEETFIRKEIHLSELPWDHEWFQQEKVITLKLAFNPNIRRVIEENFGLENIEDDNPIVKVDIPEDEWLYGFILSFADKVEVLEPVYLREIVKERALDIYNLYKKS